MSRNAAKPIMGYPSKTAACMALREKGLTMSQIATRLQEPGKPPLKSSDVAAFLSYGRKTQGTRPAVRIGGDLVDALAPDAEARDISVPELIRRLLAAIIADGMVDAVLDDGDGA